MSIQIDNGDFTRIHNDILDGLARARFTAMEFRCLFFLVRMTYGWQKKEDTISLSQWAVGIGLDKGNRGNMLNTLNSLVSQGVIYTRSNGNNRPAIWGLNKAYFETETVMQPDNSLCAESESTVMQPDNTPVIQPHNSLAETVMQPHNLQRKVLKKVKERPRARSRSGAVHPNTQPIMDAYLEALGYEPDSYAQESAAAKRLAKKGYEPADIVAAYILKKGEPYWVSKHLSLQTLAKDIPAMQQALLNGHSLKPKSTNNGVNAIRDFIQQEGLFGGRNREG